MDHPLGRFPRLLLAVQLVLGMFLTAGGALYLWTGILEQTAAVSSSPDAASQLAQAARWRGSGRLWTTLGRHELSLALDGGITQARRETHLREAKQALSTGLALSPLDPYAWAELALCLWLIGAPPAEAAHALERSFATGPAERNLLELRLRLINALAPHLSDEGRRAAHEPRLAQRFRPELQGLLYR